MTAEIRKAELYVRYPVSTLFIYNGVTLLHYLLGALGIVWGYGASALAWGGGLGYFLFAFAQMYIIMPLRVCPNCVYTKMRDGLCVSGLNLVSRRFARAGSVKDFADRGRGFFCPNNLYVAALIIPLIAILPALFLSFSFVLLGIWLGIAGLMLFRIFFIFPRIACVHCAAKFACPNARSMGLTER